MINKQQKGKGGREGKRNGEVRKVVRDELNFFLHMVGDRRIRRRKKNDQGGGIPRREAEKKSLADKEKTKLNRQTNGVGTYDHFGSQSAQEKEVGQRQFTTTMWDT